MLRVGLAVAACALAAALAPASPTAADTLEPDTTVTYCTPAGQPQLMDLYLPDRPAVRPAAAVLFVHGGGWTIGRRSNGSLFHLIAPALVDAGLAVASIDYRLAPGARWPAQSDDVACAVRWLRANAATFAIDPGRIGAWGGSAGGHLVALLATNPPDAASRIAAAVDLFGPTDLEASGWPESTAGLIAQAFAPDRRREASPRQWVDATDPPILVVHGDADVTVPLAQSTAFVAALETASVPVEFRLVPGGEHGLRRDRATAAFVTSFLVRHLAPSQPAR